jgi:LacI family transcriptional regulator
MAPMATYKDIQKVTGLSLATISKYYNGRNVLEENRVAIEAAASSLNFRVNTFARSLRSRRSRTVGVLLPTLDNNFHLTIIAGVEEALRVDDVSILICSSRPAPGEAVDFLMSKMVDGIIAVPVAHDVPALQEVAAQGVPVVAIDWVADGLDADAVVLDNEGAGRLAARHLLDHGHRRIAMIGGDPDISTMRGRESGFRGAMRDKSVPVDGELLTNGPLTVANGRSAMKLLLSHRDRPTAVFCANYELTVGAIMEVNASGLRVPEDISLVGFDSADLALVVKPALTILTQPTHAIATEAAAILRARLSAPQGSPTTVTLAGELSIGASVASLHD